MFLNISGYQFVTLDNLSDLKASLLTFCQSQSIKGTILLSPEGINVMLAAPAEAIAAFEDFIKTIPLFNKLTFKYSESQSQPYQRMLVKLKKEIITMKQPQVRPDLHPAPNVAPEIFKQWLDEGRDIVVIDTRNDYECEKGTFANAINLHMDSFSEFPAALEQLSPAIKEKTVVVFCTGGIRCEKAAPYMLQEGYKEVYQLEGGILKYFEKCQGAHYEGDCFVFDERIAVNANLNPVSNEVKI